MVDHNRIIELLREGKSPTEVANELRCSRDTVYRVRGATDATGTQSRSGRPRHRLLGWEQHALEFMWQDGVPAEGIAAALRAPLRTVERYMKGLEARRREQEQS